MTLDPLSILKIRKATRDDAEACWDLRNAAIRKQCPGYYTAKEIEVGAGGKLSQRFADWVEQHFYLATHEGAIAATGMVRLVTGKIDGIFVDPRYMKMGIGRRMLEYLEALARAHGLTELNLESTLNAAPFYRACGFRGERLAKYQSPTRISIDCVPMTKRL